MSDMPGVIDPRALDETDLADDLGPQVQRCTCVAPVL